MRVKREPVLAIKVDRESNDGKIMVKQVQEDSPVLAKELGKNNTQNSSNKKDPKKNSTQASNHAKNKKDQKSKSKKWLWL